MSISARHETDHRTRKTSRWRERPGRNKWTQWLMSGICRESKAVINWVVSSTPILSSPHPEKCSHALLRHLRSIWYAAVITLTLRWLHSLLSEVLLVLEFNASTSVRQFYNGFMGVAFKLFVAGKHVARNYGGHSIGYCGNVRDYCGHGREYPLRSGLEVSL